MFRLDGPSIQTLHSHLDEATKAGSDIDGELIRASGAHAGDRGRVNGGLSGGPIAVARRMEPD